jgi:hypothetical protein
LRATHGAPMTIFISRPMCIKWFLAVRYSFLSLLSAE